jgi:hypothetical protein
MVDKIGDPFLNDFALGLLLFIGLMLFYGIIAIHDIPARIAKKREHPHEDAIHAAGWVSLFTLHVLWPFLWIWAMAYRPDRGWGFSQTKIETGEQPVLQHELESLRSRVEQLSSYVEQLENRLALHGGLANLEPTKDGDSITPEPKQPIKIERETA